MPDIQIFSEDIQFSFYEEDKASIWLGRLASDHNKEIGSLNIIFCSDPYLHNLNLEYLQHDTLTDIITFPYEDKDEKINGDIFISIDRVRDNAEKYGVSLMTELTRVMAHGLLHLCGFNDKSAEDQKIMRLQEDRAIKLWDKKH